MAQSYKERLLPIAETEKIWIHVFPKAKWNANCLLQDLNLAADCILFNANCYAKRVFNRKYCFTNIEQLLLQKMSK